MRLISHNPCRDVGKLNERRDRRRAKPLSYAEEDRVMHFSPPLLRMLITLLADTGLRVKKAASTVVRRVARFGARVHSYTRFKECRRSASRWADNALPRRPDALARAVWSRILTPRFSEPSEPWSPLCGLQTAWRTAAKKAGLADRRIYDLRSTFASRANVCHATGLTVAHLLGHANTQILPTYVRLLDENTRALINAMDTARKQRRVAPDSIN